MELRPDPAEEAVRPHLERPSSSSDDDYLGHHEDGTLRLSPCQFEHVTLFREGPVLMCFLVLACRRGRTLRRCRRRRSFWMSSSAGPNVDCRPRSGPASRLHASEVRPSCSASKPTRTRWDMPTDTRIARVLHPQGQIHPRDVQREALGHPRRLPTVAGHPSLP